MRAQCGRFGYGFKLPLMAKDMRIARDLLSEHFPEATLLPEAAALTCAAEDSEWGAEADYSAVVRLLEERAGADLLFLSPLFPTHSHPGAPALGRARFAALARGARPPVIALGGMRAGHARGLALLGASGWAAIDGLTQN